jgi:hypothetical protein
MVSLRDGCRFEVSSVKQERPGRMPEAKGAKRTQSRPGGVPDGANRAEQSQTWEDWGIWANHVLVRAWLGGSMKCAKRTQFGPGAREWARAGGTRCPPGGRLRKTNPISEGRRWVESPLFHYSIIPAFQSDPGRAKRTQFGPAGVADGAIVQNEAKLAGTRVCGQGKPSCGELRLDVKCAKRTQFAAGGADACGPSTRRTGTRRTGEGVRCTPYGAYCTSPAKETSGRGGFPGPAESVSLRGIRVKRDRVNPHESVSYLRFSAAVPAQASSTSL